jgi:hypothetical protein
MSKDNKMHEAWPPWGPGGGGGGGGGGCFEHLYESTMYLLNSFISLSLGQVWDDLSSIVSILSSLHGLSVCCR